MTDTIQKQVLDKARALIEEPMTWTKHLLATTETGRPVMWHDEEACRWSLLGAIYRATYDLIGDKQRAARIAAEVIAARFPPRLAWINDNEGHGAILKLIDEALAR
jgi:hypothetical protein